MQIFYNFKKKTKQKKKQSTLSVLLQENHATFWLHSSKKLYINVFHFFAIVRVKKSKKVIEGTKQSFKIASRSLSISPGNSLRFIFRLAQSPSSKTNDLPTNICNTSNGELCKSGLRV